jgi:glucose/arabinose dehydrogenase
MHPSKAGASLLGLGLVLLWAAAAASPGAGGEAAYRLRRVLTARYPVHIAASPGQPRKLYVVEQHGRVLVAVDGKLGKKPFLDIRRLVSKGEEQGLFSLAFSPAYARDRTFYVDYTDRKGDTRVVAYRANRAGTAAVARSARPVLLVDQPGPQHNGGQLAFGPDGSLYASLGDGECCDDPQGRAQNMETLLGKLVRLDVDGGPPEIVALGLRNPWRFSFDRDTGDLYVADVGAGRWEEVDYLARADVGTLVNLGWDVWEGREIKEDKPPNPQGRLTFPVHVYGHDSGCSITGGFVYRGTAIPELRGRYVFGDYCSGAVWSLRVEDGEATDVRREPVTVVGLSSFGEDAKGELYAAALDGAVFKLVPS